MRGVLRHVGGNYQRLSATAGTHPVGGIQQRIHPSGARERHVEGVAVGQRTRTKLSGKALLEQSVHVGSRRFGGVDGTLGSEVNAANLVGLDALLRKQVPGGLRGQSDAVFVGVGHRHGLEAQTKAKFFKLHSAALGEGLHR